MVDDPDGAYERAKRVRAERLAKEAEIARRTADLPSQASAKLAEMRAAIEQYVPTGLSVDFSHNPGGLRDDGITGLTVALREDGGLLGYGFLTVTQNAQVFRQWSAEGDSKSFVLPTTTLVQLLPDNAIELLNSMIEGLIR